MSKKGLSACSRIMVSCLHFSMTAIIKTNLSFLDFSLTEKHQNVSYELQTNFVWSDNRKRFEYSIKFLKLILKIDFTLQYIQCENQQWLILIIALLNVFKRNVWTLSITLLTLKKSAFGYIHCPDSKYESGIFWLI